MSTLQYTIRSVPAEVDRLVRKKARLTGKSINQVLLDDIISAYDTKDSKYTGALAGLDWFIGKGSVGDDVLDALEEHDRTQKSLLSREQKKIDNLAL
jgi:hypothetical protein